MKLETTTIESTHETSRSRLGWAMVALFAIANLIIGFSAGDSAIGKLAPFICILLMSIFAFGHGISRYNAKTMAAFFLFAFAISWSYETLSILTGFPFGNYHYTDVLGPKLWLVPLLIMPAYFAVCYFSWHIAHVLLDHYKDGLSGSRLFSVPMVATFVVVMWDLSMDPARATLGQTWIWEDGGAYFGVPFLNYVGWHLCVYTILQAFALYLNRTDKAVGLTGRSHNFLILPVMMYGAIVVEFLSKSVFAEDAVVQSLDGHSWHATDIYSSLALVSLYTMAFVTVLATFKLLDRRSAT
ncbi:carotenoid biosynthesis protein [Pseudosulfitobacter sp. SM2401]|uniref:carotenoid biosynthesis protein n=1 Tax=Pseudosulfitobacter sp. SM2401 TaxID=3350098 RepID=UPI0036F1CA13